jgi:Trypsin
VQDSEGGVIFVANVFMHPKFPTVEDFPRFDMALMKLEGRIPLKPRFATAMTLAPPKLRLEPGTHCIIFGYGDTGYPNIDSQAARLRTTDLFLNENKYCSPRIVIEDAMACGFSDTNSGPCKVCRNF